MIKKMSKKISEKQGNSIPNKDNLTNLFSVLEVPYKTLDEMMAENI